MVHTPIPAARLAASHDARPLPFSAQTQPVLSLPSKRSSTKPETIYPASTSRQKVGESHSIVSIRNGALDFRQYNQNAANSKSPLNCVSHSRGQPQRPAYRSFL